MITAMMGTMLVTSGLSVYAEPQQGGQQVAGETQQEREKKEVRFTEGLAGELYGQIKATVVEDAKRGLDRMMESKPARDNIEMDEWGEFLFKYMGKRPTEYPVGPIELPIGEVVYSISATKEAKEWVEHEVIPMIKEEIYKESRAYPLTRYTIAIADGGIVSDTVVSFKEGEKLRVIHERYPLDSVEKDYLVYNTGVGYGVVVNETYLEILKGYHGEMSTMESVEGEKKGAVETMAYVTMVRDVTGGTLKGKTLKDMKIYKNLAVDMRTKELKEIKGKDVIPVEYKMFTLKPEELMYLKVDETVVAVQTRYLECVATKQGEINTANYVDFGEMIKNDTGQVKVIGKSGVEVLEDYKMYRAEQDNRVGTREGTKTPFLIFATADDLPYERVIGVLKDGVYSAYMTEETRDKILSEVEQDMRSRGLGSEYDTLVSGKSSKIIKVIIPIIVMVGLLLLGVKRMRKKEENSEIDMDKVDLLFEED